MTSFYCPKCQVLVDKSEVDQITDTFFSHTVVRALTSAGETKTITHEVIPEP